MGPMKTIDLLFFFFNNFLNIYLFDNIKLLHAGPLLHHEGSLRHKAF